MSFISKLIPQKIKNKIKLKMLKIVQKDFKNTECKYRVYFDKSDRFKDKVALVTGGSGAIGSAICFKLAAEGAIVIVAGRNSEKLKNVIKQIKSNGGKAFDLKIDVTNDEDVANKINDILEKHKKIDILVNNAGGSSRSKSKYLVDQDIRVIDDVINANLRGMLLCSKFVSQNMIKNKSGKIISISSTTGIQGNSYNVDYAAAKSGIIGATKSLAKELGKYNINVNCVSPGRINQIMFDKPLKTIPDNGSYIGRMGTTDDVANIVAFLASEESNFITGQNIIVDGGRSIALKGD